MNPFEDLIKAIERLDAAIDENTKTLVSLRNDAVAFINVMERAL